MAQVKIIAANLKQNVIDSVKKIIKRVCAYARVSTDSEEQLTSYSSQIKHYFKIIEILKEAKKEIVIIDSYADKTTLDIIRNLKVEITLIVNERSRLTKLDIKSIMSNIQI